MKTLLALIISFMLLPITLPVSAQASGPDRSFKVSVELPIPWVDYYKDKDRRTDDPGKIVNRATRKSARHSGHWHGFFFHFSNLANDDKKINEFSDIELHDGRSYGWSLNLLEATTPLTRNGDVLLVTGLGYDWNKYRFRDGVTIQNIGGASRIVQPGYEDVRSGIIKTQYITIPLLLDWQLGAHRGGKAFVALGVQGNINTRSLSRIHYGNGLGGTVRQDNNDLHFRFLRADLLAQLGIGRIRLMATYSPQSMFRGGQGPDMHPVSIGICLTP